MHSSHSICIYITYIYICQIRSKIIALRIRASEPVPRCKLGQKYVLRFPLWWIPRSSPEGCSPHSQDIAYLKGATHRLPPAKSDHIGFLKGWWWRLRWWPHQVRKCGKTGFVFFSNSSHHLESISPIGIRPQPENSLIFRPLPYITYISRMSHQDDIVAR